jgi:hypothetical protein
LASHGKLAQHLPFLWENVIKRPHLTALLCFILAGLLYAALPSNDYGGAFLLLAIFFEVVAWKAVLTRKPK